MLGGGGSFAALLAIASEEQPVKWKAAVAAALVWLQSLFAIKGTHAIETLMGCATVLTGAVLANPSWTTVAPGSLFSQVMPEYGWAVLYTLHGTHWLASVISAKLRKRGSVLHCFVAAWIALALWGMMALDAWGSQSTHLLAITASFAWFVSLLVWSRLRIVYLMERRRLG
jgi:hypothetical protein